MDRIVLNHVDTVRQEQSVITGMVNVLIDVNITGGEINVTVRLTCSFRILVQRHKSLTQITKRYLDQLTTNSIMVKLRYQIHAVSKISSCMSNIKRNSFQVQ